MTTEIATTAQERLAAWAMGNDRRVQIDSTQQFAAVTLWNVMAWASHYGMTINVTAGPSSTPEDACRLIIERFAVAGVMIP